jgi:hypothetical protein
MSYHDSDLTGAGSSDNGRWSIGNVEITATKPPRPYAPYFDIELDTRYYPKSRVEEVDYICCIKRKRR